MKENIDISKFDNIFKQQLENAVSTPPAGVWEGISSSLSASSTVAATAVVKTAIWVKIGIGVIASTAIASVVYLAVPDNSPKTEKVAPVQVRQAEPAERTEETPSVLAEEKAVMASPEVVKVEKHQKAEGYTKIEWVAKANQENVQADKNEVSNEPIEFKYTMPEADQPVKAENNAVNHADEVKRTEPETPYQPKNDSFSKKIDSSFIFIPDVVTPNGDGVNDGYLIDIRGEERVRIIIYNLNENKVFETTNKATPWNCIMPNGEAYPEGTYIVKVIYKFPGLPETKKTISLKLIR